MESESAIIAGIADEHGGRMPQCGGLGEGLADEGRSDALGAPFERTDSGARSSVPKQPPFSRMDAPVSMM